MRINSLITCSNGGRGGATLLQPTSKAGSIRVSRPKFPLNLIFIAHFPPNRKRVWAGFSPRAVSGEMGNGTSQFLPRSRRLLGAKPPVLLAQLHTNISRVKTTTVRVSVYEQWARLLSARPFSSRGTTRMDDRAMSGHWQRRGTEPWPSSVAAPTSRGEWDLIRPILADTAPDKSKSSPISFSDKWSRCKRWRQECTNKGNYWNRHLM